MNSMNLHFPVEETITHLPPGKLQVAKNSTREEITRRISVGKEYIDMFFLECPEIRKVATESNMSEFHFYRCFKQVLGVSPYQYILGKRLEYAKILLNEGSLLVSDIARACSFQDSFTFSKAFKRKYGFSPSKYRSPPIPAGKC
jgi:AraC family transcriptional regulator